MGLASLFILTSPHVRNVADNGLATILDRHLFDPHQIRTGIPIAIQRDHLDGVAI